MYMYMQLCLQQNTSEIDISPQDNNLQLQEAGDATGDPDIDTVACAVIGNFVEGTSMESGVNV